MPLKTISTAAAVAVIALGINATHAAEPIVGNWQTESGETAAIGACGSSFCITVKTGQYAGKRIGRLKGAGANYKGTITDPADGKEYSGSAKVNGPKMRLKGCALAIFCKTQSWRRL